MGTNLSITLALNNFLHCTMSYCKFAAMLFTVTRLSPLMSSSVLSLLRSVEVVGGRPLRGSSCMLVFPSVKSFTHILTLPAPMHRHVEVWGEFHKQIFPLLQAIQWQHAVETKQHCPPVACGALLYRVELELELIYLSGRVKAFRPFLPLNQSDTCTNNNKNKLNK